MTRLAIDLVYFDGCPNAETARANLRDVLGATRGGCLAGMEPLVRRDAGTVPQLQVPDHRR
jgi:hypothetical protein